MAISFKGAHFPQDIMLMAECGVRLDHATIQRWVVKYSPLLEEALHRRKRPVWVSWRLDETYIRVKGQWRYLYRAVDKYGQTIDFLPAIPAHDPRVLYDRGSGQLFQRFDQRFPSFEVPFAIGYDQLSC